MVNNDGDVLTGSLTDPRKVGEKPGNYINEPPLYCAFTRLGISNHHEVFVHGIVPVTLSHSEVRSSSGSNDCHKHSHCLEDHAPASLHPPRAGRPYKFLYQPARSTESH